MIWCPSQIPHMSIEIQGPSLESESLGPHLTTVNTGKWAGFGEPGMSKVLPCPARCIISTLKGVDLRPRKMWMDEK